MVIKQNDDGFYGGQYKCVMVGDDYFDMNMAMVGHYIHITFITLALKIPRMFVFMFFIWW